MNQKKVIGYICLAGILLDFLYTGGIFLELRESMRIWQSQGGDYGTLPPPISFSLFASMAQLLRFPQGLIALLASLAATGLCAIRLGLIWEKKGRDDEERNLVISDSGNCGTATFMNEEEARACFEITDVSDTKQDILGLTENGKALTLPTGTRLNSNIAICGASGTGKSRSISRNLILQATKRGESVIVTDPKSELYESMSGYLEDQGYIVKVFNLVNMEHSDSWNCLSEVQGNEQMAQIFADVTLSNITNETRDDFWYNAELNLLKALVLYVSTECKPEDRNIGTVYNMLITKKEPELRTMMQEIRMKHKNVELDVTLPPSPAYAPFSIFLQSSETVRTSVIIGLGSKLQAIQARAVKNITSYDEIDLELPGKQKCAYFCIVSDQDSTYDFLSSLFFSFLFIRLIRYADNQCENGMLEPKVKFVLDEFPNCCLIPDFTKKCSTIRSRGCSVACFFQNIGQMKNRYPNDQWQEIIGACDTTIFLGCNDQLSAQYFSDRTGIATVESENRIKELNAIRLSDYTEQYRLSQGTMRRPLMTPDEILRMSIDRELIFIRGQKPYKAQRFDYSCHPDYSKLRPSKAMEHIPEWYKKEIGKQESNSEKEPEEIHESQNKIIPKKKRKYKTVNVNEIVKK